jgi:hypothetical protein
VRGRAGTAEVETVGAMLPLIDRAPRPAGSARSMAALVMHVHQCMHAQNRLHGEQWRCRHHLPWIFILLLRRACPMQPPALSCMQACRDTGRVGTCTCTRCDANQCVCLRATELDRARTYILHIVLQSCMHVCCSGRAPSRLADFVRGQ